MQHIPGNKTINTIFELIHDNKKWDNIDIFMNGKIDVFCDPQPFVNLNIHFRGSANTTMIFDACSTALTFKDSTVLFENIVFDAADAELLVKADNTDVTMQGVDANAKSLIDFEYGKFAFLNSKAKSTKGGVKVMHGTFEMFNSELDQSSIEVTKGSVDIQQSNIYDNELMSFRGVEMTLLDSEFYDNNDFRSADVVIAESMVRVLNAEFHHYCLALDSTSMVAGGKVDVFCSEKSAVKLKNASTLTFNGSEFDAGSTKYCFDISSSSKVTGERYDFGCPIGAHLDHTGSISAKKSLHKPAENCKGILSQPQNCVIN